MAFSEQLINMLACGGVYALAALGYSLVFGVVRLVNFAHCDVMMLGAYAALSLRCFWDVPLWAALLLPAGICAVISFLLQRIVYRPLFGQREESLLVAAVGASLLFEYGALGIWGAAPRSLRLSGLAGTISLFGAAMPKTALLSLCVCLVCMIGLTLFLRYAPAGRAMRAVSQDKMAARLCGVEEARMIGCAFALGGALAGISGVLYASLYSLTPFMGTLPGLKAFSAAVLGGIGSIPGAVLGSFLLSFFETAASLLFGSGFRDLVSFLALLLALLFLPGGVTGQGTKGERIQ